MFQEDLVSEIKRISEDIGLKLNYTKSWDKILLDYLTVVNKLISVKPRKVLISPEFEESIRNHAKRKEIQMIIEYAKKGYNLNYFQSKKLFQSNFHDHLQSEWNIYYLH